VGRKLIYLNLDEEILQTAERIQEMALQEDNLTFFRIRAKSKTAWLEFLIEMGVMATKKEFDKFKRGVEDET